MNKIEALAEAWASIDGKMKQFRRERDEKLDYDHPEYVGSFEGYMTEADELIKRLEARGFMIVRIEQ